MIEVIIFKALLSVLTLLVFGLIFFALGYSVGKEEGIREQMLRSRQDNTETPKFSYKEWKREQEKLDKQTKY